MPEITCRMCDGDGWTAEHDFGCDGSCRRGTCPIQVQCSWCQATGYEQTEEEAPDAEPF